MGNTSIVNSKLGKRLGFGEVIISNGLCYKELKEINNNIDPVALYNQSEPVQTSELINNKNILFAKFNYNIANYIGPDPTKNALDTPIGVNDFNKMLGDRQKLIIWIGPLTRIRFYENPSVAITNPDKSHYYENREIDKIKIIDCSEFNKDIPNGFESLYVSLYGDGAKVKEAFENQKNYININNFLLIIILFIILYFLWTA